MPRVRMLQTSSAHRRGDVFECTETEARILCASDGFGGPRAERVSGRTEARVMKAEELPTLTEAHEAIEPRRGRYGRRDLRASDES